MARSESPFWKSDGLCLTSIVPERVVPKDDQFAIVVLTSETVERILSHRGTGDWELSPKKAATCKYVICCRKPASDNRRGGMVHRAALLVDRMTALQKQPTTAN